MFRFITNRPLWVNILAGFVIAVGIFSLFLLSLNLLTSHGRIATVPSVNGKNYEEAEKYSRRPASRWKYRIPFMWIRQNR
ncbi:MAG: hypothetical protein IPO53_03445 [Chitinophagaceae bacterium]|nr:hypothetical protein [Chitinophagaceae bacterium]